jgi:hypothetical protein
LVGRSGGGGEEGVSFNRTATAGTLELSFPDTWDTSQEGPGFASLAFRDAIRLAPSDTGAGAGLAAGQSRATGATLVPPAFAASLQGDLPKAEEVTLGDLEALQYSGLSLAGSGEAASLFAVPTNKGIATVACAAGQGGSAVIGQCEAIATTLKLVGATAFPLGPSEQVAEALNGAIGTLNQAVETKSKALKDAGTNEAQVNAIKALAEPYGVAAGQVGSIAASPTQEPALAALQGSLVGERDAYNKLADAAASGDERGYNDAKAAVGRAEARVKAALQKLSALGYEIG